MDEIDGQSRRDADGEGRLQVGTGQRPGLSMFDGLRETVMGFGRVAARLRSLV
jgi:hypothetical protein